MLCKLSLVALIGLNSILPVGISKPHPNTAISSSPAVISDVNKVTPRYSYQSSKTWNTAYGSITTKIQVDADTGYIQSGWVEFPNSSYIFSYTKQISANKYTCNFTVYIANSSNQIINTLIFPMTSPGPR